MQSLELVVPGIRVAFRAEQLAVYATVPFAAGDEILVVFGREAGAPSRFSIQVGLDQHLEPGDETGVSPAASRFPWRFLNHACAPTAMLSGRRLLARTPLAIGDEVTFDYDSTEWEMAEPFPCGCGHVTCRGRIAGYRHLDVAARAALAPLVAPHLLTMARAAR
ncbi:MAG: hypothetical protein R3F29_12330 [Planctomycetota bacterium]